MRQRHIETFFAVMTYGTVTQAAARLGVTQPSVTSTLRQAEKEIGFELFERSGGRLAPTSEGRALYEEAARAQASLEAIRSLCQQLRSGETTQLRVVATQTLTEEIIPATVENFTKNKKGFDIDLSTRSSVEIVDLMDRRSDVADLAFIYGNAEDAGVYSVPIGECPLCLVIPSAWKLTIKERDPFAGLSGHDFIGLNESEPVGRMGRNIIAATKLTAPVRIRTQNHRLAAELAARNRGFTILDTISATNAKRTFGDALVLAPLTGAEAVPVTAILPRAGNLTKTARRFIGLFAKQFEQRLGESLFP